MFKREDDPTSVSRRTLLGAAAATPLVCTGAEAALPPAPESLVGLCAGWLKADFESDALSRRWGALEILAASGYDYFRLDDNQRRRLPMGPEMDAIEVQLDVLSKERDRRFKAITALEPRNLHEVASLLVIAARMDLYMPGDTAPLIHQAIMFLSSAVCPRCGEPYVPPSLPKT
ncbi:hypothetical protein B7G68_02350 [Caulobacter segnis]|uniref:Uncharacterized protein n=2 Tax=Caulobacter segnis TaxID=88688 RepID=D5VEE5_CAUST|nr:hypothetical protein [Caulobacter segnis]ADG08968.1 conserved hypothetical protein [Caulobacter segnis ATCC 21756]AVQ00802.1 hypothetical protein B7G68_02350 [Caulobacter segnis]